VLFYVTVLFVCQWLLGTALDMLHQTSQYFKPARMVNDANWKQADWLIVGSSRALTGFNSAMIGEAMNKKVINIAIHDTGPQIHKLLIALAIENGYTPERIVVQYDQTEIPNTKGQLHDMDYLFLPFVSQSAAVGDYFKNSMGRGFLLAQRIFPIWKYAYFNTELVFPIPLLVLHRNTTYRSNAIGDYDYPSEGTSLAPCSLGVVDKTPLVNDVDFFDYLQGIAAEHRVAFTLVTAPTYNFDYVFEGDAAYINASSWLNCESKWFYDAIHLNALGKEVFTAQFLQYISVTNTSE
jgi:hypothetical protein